MKYLFAVNKLFSDFLLSIPNFFNKEVILSFLMYCIFNEFFQKENEILYLHQCVMEINFSIQMNL